MPVFTSPVAILLFTQPPAQEAVSKPIWGAKRHNERIWQSLETLAWSKAQATQLPAFMAYQLIEQPTGALPGRQLRLAAQAVLDRGYHTVLCIGNDCPGLRVDDLKSAAQLSQLIINQCDTAAPGTLPLGIDQRGGAYLIGLNQDALQDTAAFESLPWQTPQLAQALAAYLHQQAQWVARLPATHRAWNCADDVYPGEAVGDPDTLHQLTNLLKRLTGQSASPQTVFRSAATVAISGRRASTQP